MVEGWLEAGERLGRQQEAHTKQVPWEYGLGLDMDGQEVGLIYKPSKLYRCKHKHFVTFTETKYEYI